jgi:hypothetical protein
MARPQESAALRWPLGEPVSGVPRPADAGGLEIIVVFTSTRPTARTITAARRLAKDLSASIRLLVPHIVPFGVPLERPPVAATFLERKFRVMLDGTDVETTVDIRLCRDRWQMLEEVLPARSIVLLGSRRSQWWPFLENRLARKLLARGHRVLFV